MTGVVARVVIDAEHRLGMLRAVGGAPIENRVGRLLAQTNAVEDRDRTIAQAPQTVLQLCVERRLLRGEERDERVMRGVRDRGLRRDLTADARQTCVALVAAVDGDDRVEHCDLHDRDGARRAARSDLLAEHARIARRNRRVIQAARVDRDFVPVNHPAAQVAAGQRIAEDRRRNVGGGFVGDAEGVAERGRSVGEGNESNETRACRKQRPPG